MGTRLLRFAAAGFFCLLGWLAAPTSALAGGIDEVSFTNLSCSFASPLDGSGPCQVPHVSCSASNCVGSVTVTIQEPNFDTVTVDLVATPVGPVNSNGSWSGVLNGVGSDDGSSIVVVGRGSWTVGACTTCNALVADLAWSPD